MRFAFASLVLVGCATDPHQVTPEPANPNFTLYVSNQSFDIDRVGIQIDLGGELAVVGDFDVEGQHSWHQFHFELPPNTEIALQARAHGDVLDETVTVSDDHDYAVINFWSADESSESPFLDYFFSDDEVFFD